MFIKLIDNFGYPKLEELMNRFLPVIIIFIVVFATIGCISPATPFNNGIEAYNAKNYDIAIKEFSEAIKQQTGFYIAYNSFIDLKAAYYNRGLSYEQKGENEKAIDDYNAALRLDPNYTLARNRLALLQGSTYVAQSNTQQQTQNQNQQISTSESDYRVEVTQDGRGVVILQYIGRATIVHVPVTIQGMPVREIATNAFPRYTPAGWATSAQGVPIIRIIIPEGVTIIRESAFSYTGSDGFIRGMTALESIVLPESITSIPRRAFAGASSLTSINIPNNVTSIGEEAFRDCSSLRSITLPNRITIIADGTFRGCSSLSNITIPNGLREIGEFVFMGCSALTSITIPDSVTSIGGGTFSRSGLTSINWPTRVSNITNIFWYGGSSVYGENLGMFQGSTNLRTVVIPEGITSIPSGTFQGCTALTSITLPSTIRNIDSAFRNCSSLTTIIIPDTVTSISFSTNAFTGCRSLSLSTQAVLRRLGYTGGF